MSRLSRTLALPHRLAGALQRNGPRNVLRFGADMLARHGVAATLRYAIAPANLRHARRLEMEQGLSADAGVAAESLPTDTWSVDAEAWTRWLASAPEPPIAFGSDPRVHVLIGDRQAPRDADDADWVVLLKPGDQPSAALEACIAAAGREACVGVITFDMSFETDDGRLVPVLQPGVNPWLGRHADVGFGRYAFRAGGLRTTAAEAAERFSCWIEGQSLSAARDRWRHVFKPLVEAKLSLGDIELERARAVQRARKPLTSAVEADVSVVICTHDKGRLLRQLVRTLTDGRIVDVVVVANRTTRQPALQALEWLRSQSRYQVLIDDSPFNFSRMANLGAARTRGGRVLFLNDDVMPISEDWLGPLLQPLQDQQVGITGALLLYPDESVQHAGMYLGFRGHAGHALRGTKLPEGDYLFYGSVPREVSAVTGAAMMVRRDLLDELNGFDELLPTYLQDVDLCLRARAVGLATVWTPLSELFHMESLSIREVQDRAFHLRRGRERERFLQRWGDLAARDPMRHPAFDPDDESQRSLALDANTLTQTPVRSNPHVSRRDQRPPG